MAKIIIKKKCRKFVLRVIGPRDPYTISTNIKQSNLVKNASYHKQNEKKIESVGTFFVARSNIEKKQKCMRTKFISFESFRTTVKIVVQLSYKQKFTMKMILYVEFLRVLKSINE